MDTSQIFNTLEGSDRGFARAIASAALRNLGHIDDALAPTPVTPAPRRHRTPYGPCSAPASPSSG